jgi:hypothetical protein
MVQVGVVLRHRRHRPFNKVPVRICQVVCRVLLFCVHLLLYAYLYTSFKHVCISIYTPIFHSNDAGGRPHVLSSLQKANRQAQSHRHLSIAMSKIYPNRKATQEANHPPSTTPPSNKSSPPASSTAPPTPQKSSSHHSPPLVLPHSTSSSTASSSHPYTSLSDSTSSLS